MQNELEIKITQEGIFRKLTLNGKVYEDKTEVSRYCASTDNCISTQLQVDGIDVETIEDEVGIDFGLSDDLDDVYRALISM